MINVKASNSKSEEGNEPQSYPLKKSASVSIFQGSDGNTNEVQSSHGDRSGSLQKPPVDNTELKQYKKKEKEYQKKLYDVYLEIENDKLQNLGKKVDLAESLSIYSKNQFLRELKRIMSDDEARTLKYQMKNIAGMCS